MGREGARIVLVEANRVMGERAADLLDAEGIQGRLLLGDPGSRRREGWTRGWIVLPRPDAGGASPCGRPQAPRFYRTDVSIGR